MSASRGMAGTRECRSRCRSRGGGSFAVEPDASSGSYFWGASALLASHAPTAGSHVEVAGWPTSGWQIGAGEPEEVRSSGEDRQLRCGNSDEVTVDVAAAQLQEPNGVLELDGVAIAHGDESRGGDATDVVVRPAGKTRAGAAELVE